MGFRTVGASAVYEATVKGSVFRAFAERADAAERAEARVEALRADHADASHVCFAWRVGSQQRFADDGEPGGTAGRPILEVVRRRDLDRVLVVVVRWFGGTRLGAGGLARAYGGTAAKALDRAGEREVADVVRMAVEVPFAATDAVLRLVADDPRVHADAPSFTARGARLELTVRADALDEIRRRLRDQTRGDVDFDVRS